MTMLSRRDCELFEFYLVKEVERRRHLGEYNTDATAILTLCELCLGLVT